MLDKILQEIEELRQQLLKAERENNGKFEGEILQISQELDTLIMQYYRLLSPFETFDCKRVNNL